MRAMTLGWVTGLVLVAGCRAPASQSGDGTGRGVEVVASSPDPGAAAGADSGAPSSEGAAVEPLPTDTWEAGVYTSYYFNLRLTLPPGWDLVDTTQAGRDVRPPQPGHAVPSPPSYFEAADGMRMPVQLAGRGPLGVAQSYDSLTFIGPDETALYLVIADSSSMELGIGSFDALDERVGFKSVRIEQNVTGHRAVGGVPAYWVEGDAMTTDGDVPVGFLSLGIGAEGAPVALTVFVPMDRYASCYPLAGEGSGAGPRVDCGPLGYNSDVMRAVLDSVEIIDVRRVRARR